MCSATAISGRTVEEKAERWKDEQEFVEDELGVESLTHFSEFLKTL